MSNNRTCNYTISKHFTLNTPNIYEDKIELIGNYEDGYKTYKITVTVEGENHSEDKEFFIDDGLTLANDLIKRYWTNK